MFYLHHPPWWEVHRGCAVYCTEYGVSAETCLKCCMRNRIWSYQTSKHGPDQIAGRAETSFSKSNITVCIRTLVRDIMEHMGACALLWGAKGLTQQLRGLLFFVFKKRLPPIFTEDSGHLVVACGLVVFTSSFVLRDRWQRREGWR